MSFRDFQQEFKSLELEVDDEAEVDRLEHIAGCVQLCHTLSAHPPNASQSESPWEGGAEKEEGER